jgi:hypothetical protein
LCACIFAPEQLFSQILAVMNRGQTIGYKSSFAMSQRSPPHIQMMTIKKQLKKCMGRLDKVPKKGAQVKALREEVDVALAEF